MNDPDLFSKQYKQAEKEWLEAKESFEEAIRLFEIGLKLLKQHHKKMHMALLKFQKQQSIILERAKRPNLREVKKNADESR